VKVDLDFYIHKHHRHATDEIFALEDMRRDLVLHANNDNKLNCHIYSGHFFNDNVDVSEWKFFLTIKQNPTDSDEDAVYINDDADLDDAKDGKVVINIALASGEDLLGNYLYELKAKTSHDKIRTLCYGLASFAQGLSTRIS